jgi:hypothetical protein
MNSKAMRIGRKVDNLRSSLRRRHHLHLHLRGGEGREVRKDGGTVLCMVEEENGDDVERRGRWRWGLRRRGTRWEEALFRRVGIEVLVWERVHLLLHLFILRMGER